MVMVEGICPLIGDAALVPLSVTPAKIGATLSTSTCAVSVLLDSP
jgi:hypothetical protein